MKGVPEGTRKDPRAPIPARTMRTAAIAAAIPAMVVAMLLLVDGVVKGKVEWVMVLLFPTGLLAMLFPLILFAMARMRAGADWNQRGGRPDVDT